MPTSLRPWPGSSRPAPRPPGAVGYSLSVFSMRVVPGSGARVQRQSSLPPAIEGCSGSGAGSKESSALVPTAPRLSTAGRQAPWKPRGPRRDRSLPAARGGPLCKHKGCTAAVLLPCPFSSLRSRDCRSLETTYPDREAFVGGLRPAALAASLEATMQRCHVRFTSDASRFLPGDPRLGTPSSDTRRRVKATWLLKHVTGPPANRRRPRVRGRTRRAFL